MRVTSYLVCFIGKQTHFYLHILINTNTFVAHLIFRYLQSNGCIINS